MFPNVSLVQLRCFRSVAEQGGFTAAAAQLCMSQSAVSQAVALLERTLNAPLLVRGRDGATLTPVGLAALAEARSALAAVERLAACTVDSRSLSGTLRIGVVQSAAVRLLPVWLRRLRAEHPAIRVTLYEGTDPEIMGWVLAGVVEVGITSLTHADLVARAVFEDDYVAVIPEGHALAGQASVGLRQLDGQRMLLSAGGCETLIEELLAAAASHPEVVCLVRDNATLVSMVREGLGLTIMPELALPTDRSGLEVLRLRPRLRRTLHLLTKPMDALGPVGAAFAGLARGVNHPI
ncbi:MAG: DNA-binding transcriptional regulator, LysR family [Rubritepida sp.]|nr:DNA-binding transcriptional regulator, LysR family [Rubritepida sp.]